MIHSATVTTYKHPVLSQTDYKVKGYFKIILDAISDRLEYMLRKHSQVLVIRLVVKFPAVINASGDNECFQAFSEQFIRYLKLQKDIKDRKKRKYYDPHFIWSREHADDSHNHHYHYYLIFNQNEMKYFRNLSICEKYWAKSLYDFYNYQGKFRGLIHFCKNKIEQSNGAIIKRGCQSDFDAAFILASYIAKVHSKDKIPPNVNIFSASRIPKQLKYEV
jgi:hypothetical protein